MVDGVERNYLLINAPAGSGKTTRITNKINKLLNEDSRGKILCITYTNRAVDELKSRIKSNQVDISTIHSFINNFLKPFKKNKQVIEYYKEYYSLSNDVRIDEIIYTETSHFNTENGELGHDSLLEFTLKLCRKFPKLNIKFRKYSHIFIDEYQDTNTDILQLFYEGTYRTPIKLYLLGDKMQKIYDRGLDLTFEEIVSEFHEEREEVFYNYRSSAPIVDALNKIYNDSKYKQICKSDVRSSIKPRVILTNDLNQSLKIITSEKKEILKLVLYNKHLFEQAGIGDLFKEYNNIPKYKYGNRYTAKDILKEHEENPDDLLNLFKLLFDIYRWMDENSYGIILRTIKDNKYMNKDFVLKTHQDKVDFANALVKLNEELPDRNKSVKQWLNIWKKQSFVNETMVDKIMEFDIYNQILELPLEQFIEWYDFSRNPHASTQHSVKGEGHNKVIFVSQDGGSQPNVKMYDLFNLWCEVDINFTEFEEFYKNYLKEIGSLEQFMLDYMGEKMECEKYRDIRQEVEKIIQNIYDKFKDNDYFKHFYLDKFVNRNFSCTYVKDKILKVNSLKGAFNAYKIFYVGCSRAKEELVVLVDKKKLNNVTKFKEKFESMNFIVNDDR